MFSQELLLADYEHKFIGKNQNTGKVSYFTSGDRNWEPNTPLLRVSRFFQEWLKHAETATS